MVFGVATMIVVAVAVLGSLTVLPALAALGGKVDRLRVPFLHKLGRSGGRGGVTIARIGTQIARTATGLSDVASVRIESHGRPWNFWLMSGCVSTRASDYQLLVGLWVGNFKALP